MTLLPSSPARAAGAGDASTDSPFGSRAGSRRSRALWIAGFAVLLLVTLGVVHLATRGPAVAEAATAGHHDHAAMTGSGAAQAQPVMLAPEEARRIGVTYTTVSEGPLPTEVRTVAQVAFDETRVAAIAPKIDGWIDQLYVNYTGQPVARGTPLLSIYSPMLVSAQEELLLAARLARDVAAGTPEARRNAQELLESARRRLLYWDIPASEIARIESTGEVRKTLILRAPAGGVVVEKNVLAGQKIMAGDALYRVADLSTVWVEGDVFEQDLPLVHLGQRVTAELQALPGEVRTGRITYVYPTVDPDTRAAKIRVELPNPGLKLKPGMYATIRIAGRAGASALTVPRSAVLSTGERNLVFVKRPDGMLEPHYVQLGVTTDDRVQIVSGVRAGDTVVASATFLVDAESNLGTAMGGMGNMPGMDMTAPVREGAGAAPPAPAAPAGHEHPAPGQPAAQPAPATADMPGMTMPMPAPAPAGHQHHE